MASRTFLLLVVVACAVLAVTARKEGPGKTATALHCAFEVVLVWVGAECGVHTCSAGRRMQLRWAPRSQLWECAVVAAVARTRSERDAWWIASISAFVAHTYCTTWDERIFGGGNYFTS